MTSQTQWMPTQTREPAMLAVGKLPLLLFAVASGLSLLAYVLLPPGVGGVAVFIPLAIAVGAMCAVRPELALLAVILFTPFDNTIFFDAILPAGATAPKLLGWLMIGSFAFSTVYMRRRFRFMDDPQDLMVLLFCAIILFSSVGSAYTRTVVDEVDRIFRLVALYLVVKNLTTTPSLMLLVLTAFFVGSVYASSYAIHEVALGLEQRASGIDDNPNRYAMASVMAASIGFYLFLSSRRFLVQLMFFLGTAVIIVGLLLSASRGGLLSLSIVIGIMILRHPKRLQIAVVVAIVLAIAIPALPEQVRNRIFTPSEGFLNEQEESATNSLDRREDYLVVGMQIVSSQPILGAGYRSFRQIFPYSKYAYQNNELTVREASRVAHNVYLETLTGTGFLGLAAFVGLLYVTWRGFRRAKHLSVPRSTVWAAASGLEYALIGYVVSSMFISSEQDKFVWILVGLSSALLFYARKHAAAQAPQPWQATPAPTAVASRGLTD